MSDEINEKVEVSDAATDGGTQPQVPAVKEGTPASVVATVNCQTCQKDFERKGPNSKFCDNCAAGRDKVRRQQKKEGKKTASYVYDSDVLPTKAEAKAILVARGLHNEHVVNFCYDIGLIAGELNHVTPNRFYFQNGLRKTLESLEAEAPRTLEPIADEDVIGELLNRAELYALYDFGFWRHPETTFEQWLADRLKFKMSAFELSKILGKEDFGFVHEQWTEFAPRWNPLGLKPNYTQREALAWLNAQSETKRYLLVASRNSMKSTWARILALTLTITYPDARILIVSETNRLSKKAMKEFRGYLEMAPNSPTLFQQYFGEFTVSPDEGSSLIYDNPLARLGLPQNSVESSSMESSNTGSRFDFCLFDDPISRDNGTSNEEQRAEAVSKHGSIMKLREPAGYAINIQTPWVEGDLGDVMIQRNNEDSEHPLAVRIDPVMEIKREVNLKPLLDLKEEDVVLNFLPKLNWKFVRDEMRSPEGINFFKTQYLCLWIKQDEGVSIIFEEDDLRNHLRRREFFSGASLASTYLILDRATSIAAGADFTCLACVKIMPVVAREGAKPKTAMVLWDCVLERLKESQIVDRIVDFSAQYKPVGMVAQKDRGNEQDFDLAIRKRALVRGVILPYIRWVPTNSGDRAPLQKARRIKQLELPLSQDQLWFASGPFDIDAIFAQFLKVGGGKWVNSNSHRHDDAPDACSLGYQSYFPRTLVEPEDPKIAEQRKEQEEIDFENARRRSMADRMFGQSYTPPPQPPAQPETRHIHHFPRGGGFASLPGNMRALKPPQR